MFILWMLVIIMIERFLFFVLKRNRFKKIHYLNQINFVNKNTFSSTKNQEEMKGPTKAKVMEWTTCQYHHFVYLSHLLRD
jgi:hypothetical protein